MRLALSVVFFASFSVMAMGQNLDVTTVTDQMDLDFRGNALGTGPSFNNSLLDGSEFQDYSGADANTTIRYINAYAGATGGETESPVLDVTVAHIHPDRFALGNVVPAIPANTRPGATGGSTAVVVSDDGGQNTLGFGANNSADYYVQADVYCWNNSAAGGFEVAMVGARTFRNLATPTGGAYSLDRDGAYAISYHYQSQTAYALKFIPGNTTANLQVNPPNAAAATIFATVNAVSEGWHTFRIECTGNNIVYYLDGVEIANVIDNDHASGRAALGYREASVASADERCGHFDNLVAGPTTEPAASASNWTLFE